MRKGKLTQFDKGVVGTLERVKTVWDNVYRMKSKCIRIVDHIAWSWYDWRDFN